MISVRHTALGLALSLAVAGQALAVTTVPFWHSLEGALGNEVESLAQRCNAANPDYKIVPVSKGTY
ncbi:sn-glycerol-3-phosphate ABC transporter substrate-binding protein, partial [Klebsiella quasipneumoniae]|nr:sn-glycerol-3-phosphate ABC transporter substrate-binding protein [Klebsiella quasipneumoniae]